MKYIKLFSKIIGSLMLLCSMNLAAMSHKEASAGQVINKIVAIVGEQAISEEVLADRVRLTKAQLTASGLPVPSNKALRKNVLEQLINQQVQLQEAHKYGIEISNSEVNQAVKNIAAQNNLTVAALKEQVTQATKQSFAEYKKGVKQELTISNLQQQIIAPKIEISDNQVNEAVRKQKAKQAADKQYHVKNILISLNETPSSAEVKAAYDKADQLLAKLKSGVPFTKLAITSSDAGQALEGGDLGWRRLSELPEAFAKKVATMKKDQVVGPIRAANGLHLIQLVAVKSSPLQHSITKTHALHILIKKKPGVSDKEMKSKLDKIRSQITDTASFKRLAKQYSQDPNSAVKGGDLGWVAQGETTPSFEKAMDKLKVNQVSQPIQTNYGWHLIKVLKRKKVDDSVAFLKQQVRQQLFYQQFEKELQNWIGDLRKATYIQIIDKSLK